MDLRLTIATKITLLRLFLIPFVAMAILYHRYGTALVVFLVSGLTDLLDGLIARKFQQKSKLGALLDPMADKILLSTSFILLTFPAEGHVTIPLWLCVLVFSRDLLIVVSSVSIALTTGFTRFAPTIWGKASTVVQIACVLSVLLINTIGRYAEWIQPLFYLTFALTLFSGVHYLFVIISRFNTPEEGS